MFANKSTEPMHRNYLLLSQLLIWLVTLYPVTASAQAQSVRISLDLKNVPLTDVFNAIQSQSRYTFTYSQQALRPITIHRVQLRQEPLSTILAFLEKEAKVDFLVINRSISVQPKALGTSPNVPAPVLNRLPKRTLSGKVTDAVTGEALPGASVVVKGSPVGTSTDAEGSFSITIEDETTPLTVSYIGYQSQELTPGKQTMVTVALAPLAQALNQVVVIGYGTQTRKDLTTAVGSIKGTALTDQPVLNYEQALVGKLAGVQVLQTTGEPGRSFSFRIRGTTSITAGNAPLFVVDGVPLDRQGQAAESLNANDIASVEVLKDASAAAIYGSRGANGVVLITTKKADKQGLSVSYNQLTGVQTVAKKISMLDAYGYAALVKEGHDNAWVDFAPANRAATPDAQRGPVEAAGYYWNQTPPDLYPYLASQPGVTTPDLINTDWQDAIFRSASFTNHSLAFSGGNQQAKFYVSGHYTNQQGIVIHSDYKRYATRINMDVHQNRLQLGLTLSPSYSTENRINGDGPYLDQGVVSSALQLSPTWPIYNPDGSYNFEGNGKWRIGKDYQHNAVLNPVALATLITNRSYHSNLLGRLFLDYELATGLHYNISLGGALNNDRTDYYRPSTLPTLGEAYYLNPSNPIAQNSTSNSTNWVLEQTATYRRSIGSHHLSALAGFTSQQNTLSQNSLTATNFPNDLVQTLNAGQVTVGSSTVSRWSLLSLLGRVQYDYKEKYLLSAALRRDGSSRFGPTTKWGNFPSVSAGWRLSAEPFLQPVRAISNLKLRASYGMTGNFQINDYESIGRLQYDNYILGAGQGQLTSGVTPRNLSNANLGWETTTMTDIGLELGLLNDRFTLEMDWYDRNTSNLLLNVPVPLTTGYSVARRNIGKVNNRGLELTLSTQHTTGRFTWTVSGNIATNQNTVRALGPGDAPIIQTNGTTNTFFITQVGSPIGSYYLLKETGVYRNQADLDANPHFAGAQPGDFKFVDVDGDGQLDVDKDRTLVGNYFPDFTYGLNASIKVKGLELGFTLQGVQGVEIVNLMRRYIDSMEGTFNNTTDALNRWRSDTDPGNGQTNRANRKAKGNNGRTSSWHVEDGSYLRLQTVTLGYTLPKQWLERLKLGTARVYVSGQNLFTLTRYSGYNPEVNLYNSDALTPGVDYGTYPLARTFAGGINLTF
ncbi:SusC/RagA family TonB-linked outer membrane protein [Spirosoma flavum]|uniref:SusC/RagA family TonB-linked outer membrane protein n=1 Tax=Spirosoma flavum TaxID=2048557 RepID=A0ABW6AU98_9BACT